MSLIYLKNWQIVFQFVNRFVRIIQLLMIAGLSLSCCRIFPLKKMVWPIFILIL